MAFSKPILTVFFAGLCFGRLVASVFGDWSVLASIAAVGLGVCVFVDLWIRALARGRHRH